MSGSISGIGNGTPSGYGLSAVILNDEETAKQRVDTLTQQSADGLISDSYSGLGSRSISSLNLNAEISQDTTYTSNISAADATIEVTQNALSQITSIASNFYTQVDNLTSDSTLGTGQVAIVAASAQQALQQVASLLDTQDGSNYVFAGQDSANPPVPDPDNILTSNFYTQINTAVGQLSTNGATATAASTLAIASSNDPDTSPFSAALSQPASVLQSERTTATIGDGQQIQIGLLASANASVTSTGTSTTGSYMRDLMRALATIGSLTDSQASDPNFDALVDDTRTSLNGAITAMANEAGILGDTQSAMDASGTVITDTQSALQTQLSSVQDVDLASVATQLSLAQTQLQASYQMIDNTAKLSLVNYL